jgi:hypothetical protein
VELTELPHDDPGNYRVNISQFNTSHHEINKIKLQKVTVTFVMSVCLSVPPQGTTPLALDEFS